MCGGTTTKRRWIVRGRVQGVGFRPFVARLADALGVSGWARNVGDAVDVEAAGDPARLAEFRSRLVEDAPAAARVETVEDLPSSEDAASGVGFRILDSGSASSPSLPDVPPDLATCPACLAEFDDPRDRRAGHALLGCVACGPRYTILESLPFDRARTALAAFDPCPDCFRVYESPSDRRFHAQNVSCPRCGPKLRLDDDEESPDVALIDRAAGLIRAGGVVAVKGIGGYHLVCDAASSLAVRRLRELKRRDAKPFAVVFEDMKSVEKHADPNPDERSALLDPAAPIVLVRRRADAPLAPELAPGLSSLGAMLAHTPTLGRLVRAVGRPLVATSANAGGGPIPIDRAGLEAPGVPGADAVLDHDRPILRPADDSVVRVVGGRVVPLRAGRGLALVRLRPPIDLSPSLAVGAGMKTALAVGRGRALVLGPHLGDLDTFEARERFRASIHDLCELLRIRPARVVHDTHPDYASTRIALELGISAVAVGHHVAHVAACLAEHAHDGPALGIAWDGAGLGDDGGVWGGEFITWDGSSFRRVGSIRPFPLIGGDRAAREPRRLALGLRIAAGEPTASASFTRGEHAALVSAARVPRLAPTCTSVGRLFDAWASFLGLLDRSNYEGEAALRLEELADGRTESGFEATIVDAPDDVPRLDWRPWVAETRSRLAAGADPGRIAAALHEGLARGCLAFARRVGIESVALTGGCLQNRLLSERAEALLAADGFRVLTHRRIPPGDGGLAAGQLVAAEWTTRNNSCA